MGSTATAADDKSSLQYLWLAQRIVVFSVFRCPFFAFLLLGNIVLASSFGYKPTNTKTYQVQVQQYHPNY